jgi:hypothetical protein
MIESFHGDVKRICERHPSTLDICHILRLCTTTEIPCGPSTLQRAENFADAIRKIALHLADVSQSSYTTVDCIFLICISILSIPDNPPIIRNLFLEINLITFGGSWIKM